MCPVPCINLIGTEYMYNGPHAGREANQCEFGIEKPGSPRRFTENRLKWRSCGGEFCWACGVLKAQLSELWSEDV